MASRGEHNQNALHRAARIHALEEKIAQANYMKQNPSPKAASNYQAEQDTIIANCQAALAALRSGEW